MSREGFLWLIAYFLMMAIYQDNPPIAVFLGAMVARLVYGMTVRGTRIKELEMQVKALRERLEHPDND